MSKNNQIVKVLFHSFCILEELDGLKSSVGTPREVWNSTDRLIRAIEKEFGNHMNILFTQHEEYASSATEIIEKLAKTISEIDLEHFPALLACVTNFLEDGYTLVTDTDVEQLVKSYEKQKKELESLKAFVNNHLPPKEL
jgi:hypothetical protein